MWSEWNNALFWEGGASPSLVMGNTFFWAEDLNYGVGPQLPHGAKTGLMDGNSHASFQRANHRSTLQTELPGRSCGLGNPSDAHIQNSQA